MSSGLVFQHIGFTGHQSGVASLSSAGIAWADRTNTAHETLEKEKILRMTWTVFGPKAHIVVYLTDGSFYRLDGFEKNKFDEISQYLKSVLGVTLEKGSVATGGSQFGEISFNDKSVSMISGAKQVFEMRLDSVAQCVMGNNRNEVEIQFVDNDTVGDADMISQIRLYFPPGEEEEDLSRAEEFQRSVMERGSLRSITGDVIVEFTKEQGNFVTPRGRYGVQVGSTSTPVLNLCNVSRTFCPRCIRCIPPSFVCTERSTSTRCSTKISISCSCCIAPTVTPQPWSFR